MTGLFKRNFGSDGGGAATEAGGPFRLRVSDVLDVPRRGHLLRLKVLDGRPAVADLRPGRRIRLVSPDEDHERVVEVRGFPETGGRQTQERLERTRELDIVISDDDAGGDGRPVAIGWFVDGPVAEE